MHTDRARSSGWMDIRHRGINPPPYGSDSEISTISTRDVYNREDVTVRISSASSHSTRTSHTHQPRSRHTSRRDHCDSPAVVCCIIGVGFLALIGLICVIVKYAAPSWQHITPNENCTSIGTRTYTAYLQNIEFLGKKSCFDIPITIHGRIIPRPSSCLYNNLPSRGFSKGQLTIRGTWIVDFDEPGCIPSWDPFPEPKWDTECLMLAKDDPESQCATPTWRSTGQRGYTVYMSLSRVPLGLNPMHACRHTPLVIDDRRPYLPDECHLVEGVSSQTHWGVGDVLEARFIVDDPTCSPAELPFDTGDAQHMLCGSQQDL
ncbi:hypothetical protein PM082_021235 [Marasmius tenuissimus]|nr:hypothetical protein PM082_021235 [Marasmius tenuissimus]